MVITPTQTDQLLFFIVLQTDGILAKDHAMQVLQSTEIARLGRQGILLTDENDAEIGRASCRERV